MNRTLTKSLLAVLLLLLMLSSVVAQELAPLPSDAYFADFKPMEAPQQDGLYLKQGDRLAICGDSITEQKMYSRIMETYLTVCVPQLELTIRQHGWSGERAPGCLSRMKNDIIRFKPTIATTCYAMNDHCYQPYKEEFGKTYEDASREMIKIFKENDVRVIQGAAGTVGKMPSWVKQATGTVKDLNLSLCEFRNIDVRLADEEGTRFADVYLPMLIEGYQAKQQYGDDYMISGKDGVHPGWAGHLVMAYAFLEAMGLDGEIGTLTVDLKDGSATASEGHSVVASEAGKVVIRSTRYPFCATGPVDNDGSIRSGMQLVPFNEKLNRLMLVVKNPTADRYKVTWGEASKSYTADELKAGVNLAADFDVNPLSEAFTKVDQAVAEKQKCETWQMKTMMHGNAGRNDMEATVAETEKEHDKLVQAVKDAFVPVEHTIVIEAE